MKLSVFRLLKVYFTLLGIVVVLGFGALILMIPHKNRLQKQILELPYAQEKIREGFKIVEDCGSYKRQWNYESTSICLEKEVRDSSGKYARLLHEVIIHETGSASPSCEYRIVSPTDTVCLAEPY